MKSNTKNVLKKSLFLAFVLIAITIVISIVIRYDVEGEKTLPYSISKILITSHAYANDSENKAENTIWDINLKADNNIYIYIDKNDAETTETIKEIKINHFNITKSPKIGNIKVYRPTGDLGNNLYQYSVQDYSDSEIVYTGSSVDTLKNLDVRNEGGMIGFRVSLEDLGNYTSNESVIYNGSLLSEIGVTNEDMQFSILFDLTITLDNDVSFTGTFQLDLPCGDIINEEEPHIELTDFSDIIFKRI
ncbi:MAG: hypothetical protein IJ629_00610 [Clostridia bacterium]|nr:hypothetical protein [Clostridia bacterium]